MRLCWATDLHLNHASDQFITNFADAVMATSPDALLLTGDIAEGRSLEFYLTKLVKLLGDLPIMFVLGNHDYYHASIADVRQLVGELTAAYPTLKYLPALKRTCKLTDNWALVGVDGWGDGRVGEPMSRRISLNDWAIIADLWEADAVYNIPGRLAVLQKLADADATLLRKHLNKALEKYQNVMVVSHVAPFEDASWHEGHKSDKYILPWFTWKVGGDVLLQAADHYRTRNILALCGHSHSPGTFQPRVNLQVKTGGAVYGNPTASIVEVFDL